MVEHFLGDSQVDFQSFHSLQSGSMKSDSVLLNDWHVVAKSIDLEPGMMVRFRLLEKDLVIWRGDTGSIRVWRDRCPHRSVRLSNGRVVEDTLVCAYHGMTYNSTGHCINVPAHPNYTAPKQARVETYQAQERYGLVFVCLGTSTQDIPPFPEWDDSQYRFYITGSYAIQCNGLRAIENFLDVSHFPFLHQGVLGDLSKPEIEDYEALITQDGVCAKNIRIWQPDPYGTGTETYVNYDYWAFRPLTAYLRKTSPSGDCLTLLYTVSPVNENSCIVWMSGAMNYGYDLSNEEVCRFQDEILRQDLQNLESHCPQALPLDHSLEFHTPSDRTSLVYRRWLKQLGVTYGTV
jgi:phenylpropionate dioxygenase-like ring-hydroxylating dioxygenase large terminal subunit